MRSTTTTIYLTLIGAIWLLPALVMAESTVTNSVSVSASGGESTLQVKTIINGQTVEDVSVSSDNPISYTNQITESSTTIQTTATTTDSAAMQTLLDTLQALLAQYVSILNQIR